MRRWLVSLSLVAVVAVGIAVAQDEKPKAKAQPKDKKPTAKSDAGLDLDIDQKGAGKKAPNKKELLDKISYGIGQQMGQQLVKMKQAGFDIDQKRVLKGMEDALAGKEQEFSDDEINKAFNAFEPLRRAALTKAGDDYLVANKEKEGVKTLPSGLQYKVLASGKGASPKLNDTVRVHYRGKLIDGKVFDQSYNGESPTNRDQPFEFRVKAGPGGVIQGWVDAVLKMKPGDKWQITLPADLAYGERGSPPVIGPNAVLVFDVQLIEIVE